MRRERGDAYPPPHETATLQQRITNTLLHALLDAAKPLTTHYGAVVGLMALGPQVFPYLCLCLFRLTNFVRLGAFSPQS